MKIGRPSELFLCLVFVLIFRVIRLWTSFSEPSTGNSYLRRRKSLSRAAAIRIRKKKGLSTKVEPVKRNSYGDKTIASLPQTSPQVVITVATPPPQAVINQQQISSNINLSKNEVFPEISNNNFQNVNDSQKSLSLPQNDNKQEVVNVSIDNVVITDNSQKKPDNNAIFFNPLPQPSYNNNNGQVIAINNNEIPIQQQSQNIQSNDQNIVSSQVIRIDESPQSNNGFSPQMENQNVIVNVNTENNVSQLITVRRK